MTKFTKEQQDILEAGILFREGSDVYDIKGSLKGSVLGDVEGSVEGDVWGSVKGNVEGNVGGNVYGSVEGSVKGGVGEEVLGSFKPDNLPEENATENPQLKD